MSAYYAEVCIREIQVAAGKKVSVCLAPIGNYSLHDDVNNYFEIVFRQRNGSRAFLCASNVAFLIEDNALKKFCTLGMLLFLKQQRTSFVVEIEINDTKDVEQPNMQDGHYVITKMTFN